MHKKIEDVNVTFHDATERSVVDSADLITDETRLEQHFHETEDVRHDSDDVPVCGERGWTILPYNGNVRRYSDDVSLWEPANRSNHLDLSGP